MTIFINNMIRSALTASVIVAGLAAQSEAAELRKKTKRAQPQATLQINQTKSATGVLSGTMELRPDLVILPAAGGNSGQPNSGYCGPWNGGDQSVRFYVRNIGNTQASASHVQVNFGGPYHDMLQVPALAPNQQVLMTRDIPIGAWGSTQIHSSANFLIAADHLDAMNEVSEANNYGQSKCVGPAT